MASMYWVRRWILATCFVLPLWASDFDGKWRMPFTDQSGKERESIFTFGSENGRITGSLLQSGKTLSIEDLQLKRKVLTFYVHTSKGVSRYKAQIAGDMIKFDIWRDGSPRRELQVCCSDQREVQPLT
jgi:hypothetical protein